MYSLKERMPRYQHNPNRTTSAAATGTLIITLRASKPSLSEENKAQSIYQHSNLSVVNQISEITGTILPGI